MKEFEIRPDPDDPRLSVAVAGIDQDGKPVETAVVTERPLTLFLNAREIVTMMTIGDRPDLLAVGYLLNQNMLKADDEINRHRIRGGHRHRRGAHQAPDRLRGQAEEEDPDLGLRPGHRVRRPHGRIRQHHARTRSARVKTSWLYQLTRKINTEPSLYLKAGAIHGCVLAQEDRPLIYMEDVGRHNAVDKIAGYMFLNGIAPDDKIFYTTGRLTSEMVIKTVKMRIPVLVSRSGFTAWGVELAQKAGLTLIGRARGKRFVALSGLERIVFDADPEAGRGRGPQACAQGQPCGGDRLVRMNDSMRPRGSHGRRPGRRPIAPHGRRRQGPARAGRQAHAGPCHRSAVAAGRPHGHQCQRRPAAVRRLRACPSLPIPSRVLSVRWRVFWRACAGRPRMRPAPAGSSPPRAMPRCCRSISCRGSTAAVAKPRHAIALARSAARCIP